MSAEGASNGELPSLPTLPTLPTSEDLPRELQPAMKEVERIGSWYESKNLVWRREVVVGATVASLAVVSRGCT